MAGAVAFLGLGIMGSRMAANLRRAGFELVVWNRTRARAEQFAAAHGAEVAATPAEAGARSDSVVTMLVDGPQVERVLTGDEGVASAAGGRDVLCVDMSTIGPVAARRIAARLGEQGMRFVDAPVTGSSPKAQDGTLTIMAGGEHEDFARALPLFEAMGKLIVHVGEVGQGQTVKIVNNAVAAANTAVVAEALLLASRAGVDLDALVEVMNAGSGGSAMLALKQRPLREHDYTTLFKLAHMLKDVRLCLEEAEAMGFEFDLAARTAEILAEAEALGHGDDDFAALLAALEARSGITLA